MANIYGLWIWICYGNNMSRSSCLLRLELHGRLLLFCWKGDELLGWLCMVSYSCSICFWRVAITFIQGSSLSIGVLTWFMLFSSFQNILSAESASWYNDRCPTIGARICVIIDGNFSIPSPRRIISAILCCPRVIFIWRNSWNGVLFPVVTFVNSPQRASLSEQPVHFNMAFLRCVYSSCSATSSTIEAGSDGSKVANLVAWEVIFRVKKMALSCTNHIFILRSLKGRYGANDAVMFASFSAVAIWPSSVNSCWDHHLLWRPDKYTGPRKLLKYKWLTTNQARMTKQGCCFERPKFIMANRKCVRQTVTTAGWWLLEQDLVAGAGLDSWYKTGSRWISGHWFRIGICWCRKVVADAGLVAAAAGKWLLVQDGSCWCRLKGYFWISPEKDC